MQINNESNESNQPQNPSDEAKVTEITQTRSKSNINAKKALGIAGGLLLTMSLMVGAYLLGRQSTSPNNTQHQPASLNEEVENKQSLTPAKLVESKKFTLADKQIVFFDKAEKVENLRLITSDSVGEQDYGDNFNPNDNTSYYKIGETTDGHTVYFVEYIAGLGTSDKFIYINEPKSEIIYTNVFENFQEGLVWLDDITINSTAQLKDIIVPENIVIDGQKLAVSNFFGAQHIIDPSAESSDTSEERIDTQGNFDYYRVVTIDESSYQIIRIEGRFNNIFSAIYNMNGELTKTNDEAINISWSEGAKNSSVYENAGAGCGNTGFMVPKNVNDSNLRQVGTTPQGQKVFQLPADHPFVVDLYEKDYNNGEFLNDESLKNLTIQQLTQQHGYFLVENAFGDYLVMLRNDIFIRGGCAKPVVYLYPTATTNVSVEVGADVTLSDPLYPAGGWRNVTAQPNGSLTYQELSYGSLFWEGFGYGTYPAINEGTIVPTALALTTMRQHLNDLGLNQQESNDFMDFWQYKLPSKPFTRLTWFTTEQLDQLAPLYVVPKPDTVHRVFLDFEGLDEPYDLPLQQLHSVQRYGFTLIEWGGLARDGSVPEN